MLSHAPGGIQAQLSDSDNVIFHLPRSFLGEGLRCLRKLVFSYLFLCVNTSKSIIFNHKPYEIIFTYSCGVLNII